MKEDVNGQLKFIETSTVPAKGTDTLPVTSAVKNVL
jgi:hypothetical protein